MSYFDHEIKRQYISLGEETFANDLIGPLLEDSISYDRSVGFFSSSVLTTITDGILAFIRNGGHIRLIASPSLSQEDVNAINLGYKQRAKLIEDFFSRDFIREVEQLDDLHLKLLAEMIAKGILDIKIAVVVDNGVGIYHDKLGVMKDMDGNIVSFSGSANSSLRGYEKNYDRIKVFKSWDSGQKEFVEDDINEFEDLWNGSNSFVETYNYSEAAKKKVLEVVAQKGSQGTAEGQVGKKFKLRPYQEEARTAWFENDCNGFLVMATGTGKTWTAIYSAKQLAEREEINIVICAPYIHLLKQWAEDLEKVFSEATIVLVSSENPTWDQQIIDAFIARKHGDYKQLIIVSTIVSFNSERFSNAFGKFKENNLLIVDEAHNYKNRDDELHKQFKYMLGLSATPYSGKSAQSGQELISFFGGLVYSLPIEKALELKCLVKYNYYPLFVYSSENEEQRFKTETSKMISCFRDGVLIDPEKFMKAHRARLRVIAMAEEKIGKLEEVLDFCKVTDHFIVYCGDGKTFQEDGTEKKHIQTVKNILAKKGFKPSQFTAKESMDERMTLVDMFNKGEIDSLVAIRCLDEGINIPSITDALILASNDSYREFVQRRGRILRLYDNKKIANIYDLIVLPHLDMTEWAKIEFRRMLEYARLSENSEDVLLKLNSLLSKYGLSKDDIDIYDYEDMEADNDE